MKKNFLNWDQHQAGRPRPKIVPIDCTEAERIFADASKGDGSDGDVLKLRHHLAGCSTCSEAMTQLRFLLAEQSDA